MNSEDWRFWVSNEACVILYIHNTQTEYNPENNQRECPFEWKHEYSWIMITTHDGSFDLGFVIGRFLYDNLFIGSMYQMHFCSMIWKLAVLDI